MASGEYSTRQPEAATRRAHTAGTWRARTLKLSLGAGFLALAAAVAVARASPATGYELSIYRGTPVGFWAGTGLAAFVALVAAWYPAVHRSIRVAAALLAAATGVAIAGLPILRGYHFVGAGDALTHLGWVKDITAGTLDPTAFLYPGIHTSSLLVSGATGATNELAIQYVVLAFAVVYLAFVPLTVRAIAGSDRALAAGALAALLLLPVNNVSVHLFAHPTTQAIMLSPLLLYLLVRYVLPRGPDDPGRADPAPTGGTLPGNVTRTGMLLALGSVTVVLVHPQTALNVIVVFATVTALQAAARWWRVGGIPTTHRLVFGQTAFAAAVFLLWAPRNDRVQGATSGVLNSLLEGRPPASEIAQRGASLSELGGSLGELFVKLFGPGMVFAALTGLLVLAAVAGRLDSERPHRNAVIRYFGLSLVPLVGAFLLFLVASVTTQHFRYLGFVMLLATVLGAVALVTGVEWLGSRLSPVGSRGIADGALATVAVLLFVVVLPLSLLTAYASPFMFQPSPGVSEMTMTGYENAFEHRADGVPFVGIRGGPERFAHATFGTELVELTRGPGDPPPGTEHANVGGLTAAVPEAVFAAGNATRHYEEDRYLPVTRRDVERETDLFDGFRYSARGFRSLEATPGVDRVQSNGEFRLYRVNSERSVTLGDDED